MYNLEFRPLYRNFRNTDLDKFLEQFTKTGDSYSPACEIVDDEKYFTISLDIPGLNKDDINLEIKENHLYISGERKSTNEVKDESILKSERRYGKFLRTFTLPQNVNADGIKAIFDKGVLEVTLPKELKTQVRKISISDKKELSLEN